MQVLRIARESIKQDFRTWRDVYFLDIVENNSAKNLTNGTLQQVNDSLSKYVALYPRAYVKREYKP